MASDVARFLREKYLQSLTDVELDLPASISGEFQDIGVMFKGERAYLTTLEFISSLYDLNDILAEWRIFMEQRKGIKKIFRRLDLVRKTKDRLSGIRVKLNEAVNQAEGSSSLPILSPWDRFTFYEPDPSNIIGFEEQEKKMVDWLSASSEEFKAVGIYGMGGSGKTALVKQVLKNPKVRDKFKHNIIWACLSDLTCEHEIDIRIVKYLLNSLGCDIDSLAGNRDEDEVWLMEQLEHKLLNLGNYVIVFDDVWHCNSWFTDFYRKLAESKKITGGAVIVTSRIKEVAKQMVSGKNLIHLNPLDYKNSNFLKDIVSQSTSVKDDKLVDEIFRYCHGLALAAKKLPHVEAPTHIQEAKVNF